MSGPTNGINRAGIVIEDPVSTGQQFYQFQANGPRTNKKGQRKTGKRAEPMPFAELMDNLSGAFEKPVSFRRLLKDNNTDLLLIDFLPWSPRVSWVLKHLVTRVTKKKAKPTGQQGQPGQAQVGGTTQAPTPAWISNGGTVFLSSKPGLSPEHTWFHFSLQRPQHVWRYVDRCHLVHSRLEKILSAAINIRSFIGIRHLTAKTISSWKKDRTLNTSVLDLVRYCRDLQDEPQTLLTVILSNYTTWQARTVDNLGKSASKRAHHRTGYEDDGPEADKAELTDA
ncbi:MAG: hypothetical protein Q9181_004176 [Wetmoreana brouardii]